MILIHRYGKGTFQDVITKRLTFDFLFSEKHTHTHIHSGWGVGKLKHGVAILIEYKYTPIEIAFIYWTSEFCKEEPIHVNDKISCNDISSQFTNLVSWGVLIPDGNRALNRIIPTTKSRTYLFCILAIIDFEKTLRPFFLTWIGLNPNIAR